MELSKTHRNLISRATLLFAGVVLLYWGYCVFDKAGELRAEWRERQQTSQSQGVFPARQRDSSGAIHLWLLSYVLFGAGGIATTLAVVPTEWLTRIPVAPTTGRD